ncbi:MAG: V-type ATP synthase subunit E [Sedimentisphaerales bacterium]
MEAEQVVEKILSESKAEAEKIKNVACEKEAAEQAKLDEQLAEYRKQTEILAQNAAKTKQLHLLSAARMEIAKELLTEKRKILDEVFARAREQLLNLPDKEYRQLMTDLMLKAVETGDEEVIVDKNEGRIDQDLINQVNEQLRENLKFQSSNLKLSDQRQDLGGGFILRRGKIKNNVSFEVLLAQARRELEIELAKELFSE